MNFTGTSGNDNIVGTSGADTFDMTQGGNDIVSGGDGSDIFNFGAAFNANDRIDGGAGEDTVTLDGDYSAGVRFTASTMINVENLTLAAGHSYTLNFDSHTAQTGQTVTINASALGAGDVLDFNGSRVASGFLVVEGGAGNDVVTGGQDGNNFFMSQGGNDRISGGAGLDQFAMGATFTASDRIVGGGGSDTLSLNGDYSSGVVFTAATMTGVDNIELVGGHSYTLTIAAATFTGALAIIDGSDLGVGDKLIFDGSANTTTKLDVDGGAGADVLTGGAFGDLLDGGGGGDIINGGGGDDSIRLDATQTGAQIDGGTGNDTLQLVGDFSAGYTFTAHQLTSIESIVMDDGNSYKLASNDANVAAGQTLLVNASQLTGSNFVSFNGDRETDGSFSFRGGAGNDIFAGGAQSDSFDLSTGGNDIAKGEGGDDTITMNGALTAADRIDGGAGNDTVILDGDYSAGLSFKSTTMVNVEDIGLIGGDSYRLTTADQTVAAGQSLRVDATNLLSTDTLNFNGSKETDGSFVIVGGDGNDVIVGGHGGDTLTGGLGADTLTGGAGADVFTYNSASDSMSTTYDRIMDFDANADKFDVVGAITAVDTAITTGSLSTSHFDSGLTAAVNAAHLGAMHAVLFTASAGSLKGDTFLIIDQNGTAGYQAGEDLVIRLENAAHLDTLATGNFI